MPSQGGAIQPHHRAYARYGAARDKDAKKLGTQLVATKWQSRRALHHQDVNGGDGER
jgi:hypothetical protein